MVTPTEPNRDVGERRLAHPPSDRYTAASTDEGVTPAGDARTPSWARGVSFAIIAGIAGAAIIVALGGPLAVSAGLLVVAAVLGRAVALALTVGAAGAIQAPSRPRIAVLVAVAGVLLGQLGLWLFGRTEGGVLGLSDYLGQTFGLLVPLRVGIAAVVAWWSAR